MIIWLAQYIFGIGIVPSSFVEINRATWIWGEVSVTQGPLQFLTLVRFDSSRYTKLYHPKVHMWSFKWEWLASSVSYLNDIFNKKCYINIYTRNALFSFENLHTSLRLFTLGFQNCCILTWDYCSLWFVYRRFNKESHTHRAPTLRRSVSSPPNPKERDSILASTYPIMKSIPLCTSPEVHVMLIWQEILVDESNIFVQRLSFMNFFQCY